MNKKGFIDTRAAIIILIIILIIIWLMKQGVF